MSPPRFTPEFKDEAVRQIIERGYSVAEVSARLGVSAHSLYKWVNAVKPDKTDQQASELLAAKSEILRLAESITGHGRNSTDFAKYRTVGYSLEQKLEVIRKIEI